MLLNEDLLLILRINIHQIDSFPGTTYIIIGNLNFLIKKILWILDKKILQEKDYEMIKKVFPKGIILRNLISICYNGIYYNFFETIWKLFNNCEIKKRLPINKF